MKDAGNFSYVISIALLLIIFIAFSPSYAQENEELKNDIGLFLGGTTSLEGGGTDFSIGLDYARRLNPEVGIGIWAEAVLKDETEWTFGLPVYYYIEEWYLRLAPGIELEKEASESDGSDGSTETTVNFLLRVGGGYEIEMGGFSIVPSIDVDILRSEVSLVWGAAISKKF